MNLWLILVIGGCAALAIVVAIKRLAASGPRSSLDALGAVSQSWITDKRSADRGNS
jgi:hypothetical protein